MGTSVRAVTSADADPEQGHAHGQRAGRFAAAMSSLEDALDVLAEEGEALLHRNAKPALVQYILQLRTGAEDLQLLAQRNPRGAA